MNFKKMAKRFWTLSKHHEGFTLVELIVVIAIMAILAGVAVPAYTGYINKANEASDLQLLGAINTAFAAACMENNVSPKGLTGVSFDVDAMLPNTYPDEFAKYYNGNTGKFKVIEALYFVPEEGVFADEPKLNASQQAVLNYLKETYGAEGAEVDQWLNSTFNDIGAGKLLGQVDWVTGLANDAMTEGSDLYNIVNTPEYIQNLMTSLNMNQEQFEALITEKTEDGTLNSFLANSLVLNVAQNASSNTELSKDKLTSQLTDGSIKNAISTNLGDSGDPETALAQAALAYGMYTSYANYIGDEDMIKNATNMSDLSQLSTMLNDMYGKEDTDDTTSFQEYMAGQGAADLDGYLAALEMAGAGAAQDSDLTLDILNNGFMGLEGLLGSLGN